MNLLTVLLQSAPTGGGSYFWIMMIAVFAIMYFFMIRPLNKKQKEIQKTKKRLNINTEN